MAKVVVRVEVSFAEADGQHVELPPNSTLLQTGDVVFDPDVVDADVSHAVVAAAGGVAQR